MTTAPTPAPAAPRSGSREWARWLPLLLLWAAIVFGYFDTARAMVAIWARSETFAHAFLVPPISAWLIWRQRKALAALEARPNAWMLLPMGCAALVWLLGDLSASNAVAQFAFVALLVLAVPAAMGLHIARALMFPLGFLFFAVPFGEFLMPQLMEGTANFTVLALQLSGIPVYREGLHFVIPSGNWSVVEACSGVRYLIASVMVGTLFAYLNYHSMRRRWIFVAVSIGVPVVANWVRAYLIVMLGHLSGNQLAVGADHLIYGWLFFGIVIMLMFMIGTRWSEPDAAAAAAVRQPAAPASVSALALAARPRAAAWVVTAGLALAIAALPRLAAPAFGVIDAGAPPTLIAPPALAGGWQRAARSDGGWKPAWQTPMAEMSATYSAHASEVGVYLGYYRGQTYARKLVSSENVLVASKDPVWAKVEEGSRTVDVAGTPVSFRSTVLRSTPASGQAEPQRLIVWKLYWVDGRFTSSDPLARVYGAASRLLGRGDDAAVIVLHTSAGNADQDADAVLARFAGTNLAALDALLRHTRDATTPFAAARPPAGRLE